MTAGASITSESGLCFPGSLSLHCQYTALLCLFLSLTLRLLDLPLVLWTCFLATNLTSCKEGLWFLPEYVWQWEVCVQISLEKCEYLDTSAKSEVSLLLLLMQACSIPLLLPLWPFCFYFSLIPHLSRAQSFSLSRFLILPGHVKDAEVCLESQTLWRKRNKHKYYHFFPPKIQ